MSIEFKEMEFRNFLGSPPDDSLSNHLKIYLMKFFELIRVFEFDTTRQSRKNGL